MANICEFYPCHEVFVGFDCAFCRCPEYKNPNCSGNPKWIDLSCKGKLKDCSDCVVPHTPEYVKANSHFLKTVY